MDPGPGRKGFQAWIRRARDGFARDVRALGLRIHLPNEAQIDT